MIDNRIMLAGRPFTVCINAHHRIIENIAVAIPALRIGQRGTEYCRVRGREAALRRAVIPSAEVIQVRLPVTFFAGESQRSWIATPLVVSPSRLIRENLVGVNTGKYSVRKRRSMQSEETCQNPLGA